LGGWWRALKAVMPIELLRVLYELMTFTFPLSKRLHNQSWGRGQHPSLLRRRQEPGAEPTRGQPGRGRAKVPWMPSVSSVLASIRPHHLMQCPWDPKWLVFQAVPATAVPYACAGLPQHGEHPHGSDSSREEPPHVEQSEVPSALAKAPCQHKVWRFWWKQLNGSACWHGSCLRPIDSYSGTHESMILLDLQDSQSNG
jgi:hypothetical protein